MLNPQVAVRVGFHYIAIPYHVSPAMQTVICVILPRSTQFNCKLWAGICTRPWSMPQGRGQMENSKRSLGVIPGLFRAQQITPKDDSCSCVGREYDHQSRSPVGLNWYRIRRDRSAHLGESMPTLPAFHQNHDIVLTQFLSKQIHRSRIIM